MQLKNQQPQPVANPIVDNAVPELVIRAKAEIEREDIIKKLNELKMCLKKVANGCEGNNKDKLGHYSKCSFRADRLAKCQPAGFLPLSTYDL